MPAKLLTASFCETAPTIDGRLTEWADTKERGLALRVTPAGARSWTFRYRTFAGQQRRMSLGKLSDVSLAKARERAALERAKVLARQDPASEAQEDRDAAREALKLETVAEIGARYFDDAAIGRHKPNAKRPKRPGTIAQDRNYFDKYVAPAFGKERLADLTRARIQGLVNRAPSLSAGRQVRVVLHAIFEFAIWQELATANPCKFVSTASFAARERVLSDDELRSLWAALLNPGAVKGLFVSRSITLALMLSAATLQRRGEVAGAKLAEFDLDAMTWTIPSERTKNHRTHVVPLSDFAAEMVREAIGLAGKSTFLFPSPRVAADDDQPITPAAISHAFRRIAAKIKLKNARPHDLRRTGATALAGRLGVDRFTISQVLNHASDSGNAARVTAVYARYDHLAEKRAALDAWGGHLREIVGM